MDNDDDDFVNYSTTKKRKTKRNKDALKYSKTCAIYGIFDCTCCKKDENSRVYDSVIDETINQPSTSKLSDENNAEQNSNDELSDDIIDVGTDCVPSTSNILSLGLKYDKEEICDRIETNDSTEINKTPEDVMEYVNTVYEESGFKNIETNAIDPEINILNEIDEVQPEQPNDLSAETMDASINATPTTTSNSNSPPSNETIAIASIKSEVLAVTEEEEEIDVVNIPADDIQNTLIDNTITAQPETTENEIKTELSDDENQIIDILNVDGTDRREDLVNNLENTTNMESTSNVNEDDIIDVENLYEASPPSSHRDEDSNVVAFHLRRRRQMKRRLKSQITINFRKRLRSVMTIDLINSSRDDSIIEITDSPVVPRNITEVINVDDDENDELGLNTTCSPHRMGLGNCPVCLESLAKKEIMSTICGHVYCARCIKNVIKTTKKCPNCRKNLTLKSIHPLFI